MIQQGFDVNFLTLEWLGEKYTIRLSDEFIIKFLLNFTHNDKFRQVTGYDIEKYFNVMRDNLENCFVVFNSRCKDTSQVIYRIIADCEAMPCGTNDEKEEKETVLQSWSIALNIIDSMILELEQLKKIKQ